jgi:multiple sugar transport system substrate-binding protein
MFTYRRTVAAACTLVLAGMAAVAGCGGGGGSGTTTLKIWDFSPEQTKFHQQVAAEFTKEHPKIKIQWRSIAQEQYETQALPLAFKSRQAPDIFFWAQGPQNMAQLNEEGWIQPIIPGGKPPASFTARWPQGSFIPGVNTYQGNVYSFPFSENKIWGPGYMYLNKQVFAKAGLDVTKPPRTWTDLSDDCAAIKAKTSDYCLAVPTKETDFQRLWYALAGGSLDDIFFDYKNGRFDLDNPALLRTFAYIQQLNKAGYIAPGLNDKAFSRAQFAAGKAGIYMDGAWMPSTWAATGFTSAGYGIAPHPVPDTGATGALAGQQDGNKYFVSSQSAHPKQAWTFLEWMTRPDGYFAQNYLKDGFGTLGFADNAKYITDPAMKQIIQISSAPGFRATVPVPQLKCPDLVKSKAYIDALAAQRPSPDWEFQTMVDALVHNENLASAAAGVAAARNKVLDTELKQEAAKGLKVSIGCYTFPSWNYVTDYPLHG